MVPPVTVKASFVSQITAALMLAAIMQPASGQSPSPSPRIVIRDKASAIRVAESILASAYGIKEMEGNRPYKAFLLNGVWKVTGTVPKDAVGDPLFVDLDQEAGCVVALGIRY